MDFLELDSEGLPELFLVLNEAFGSFLMIRALKLLKPNRLFGLVRPFGLV